MRVVPYTDAIDKLSGGSSRTIVFSCDSEEAGKKLLADIDIEVTSNYFTKNKTYVISPVRNDEVLHYWSIPENARDKFEKIGVTKTEIKIPDFKNSDKFYKKFAGKSKFKIISDNYSVLRGRVLFELIGEFETKLRELFSHDDFLQSDRYKENTREIKNLRSEGVDHKIVNYSLSELLEKYLLQPSSDKFYLDKLREIKGEHDAILARHTIKLDELGLLITEDEFKQAIKVRNAVMHFKVIELADVKLFIEVYEKLLQYDFSRSIEAIGTSMDSK